MTLTEQILKEEFEKRFGKRDGDKIFFQFTAESVLDYVKDAITRTREECANKLKEYTARKYVGCIFDDETIELWNRTISDAASKIREMK